jgi:hypothetical protein
MVPVLVYGVSFVGSVLAAQTEKKIVFLSLGDPVAGIEQRNRNYPPETRPFWGGSVESARSKGVARWAGRH